MINQRWYQLGLGLPLVLRQVRQQLLQRWVQLEAFVKRQRSTLSAELGGWPGHGANESVALQVPMEGQRWWVGWSGGAIPVVETD